MKITSPTDAIKNGIVYLSEDRKQLGLFLNMTIQDKSLFVLSRLVNRLGLIKKGEGAALCDAQIRKLAIKTPSAQQLVHNLSGGNQQK